MELLSVQRARSAWIFDANDLNPRGKEMGTELLNWLKDAYRFSKFPASVTDLDDSKALYFGGGKFHVPKEGLLVQPIREEAITVELRVYNDGIVGDTRSSTDDTDAFLSDVVESFAQRFSSPYTPAIIRKKLYVSELNVRTAKKLMPLNPKLAKFAEKLSAVLPAKLPAELSGIVFWPDVLPKPDQSIFRFERKWGVEFSDNRYFSTASLQTDKHLILLEELELALS